MRFGGKWFGFIIDRFPSLHWLASVTDQAVGNLPGVIVSYHRICLG